MYRSTLTYSLAVLLVLGASGGAMAALQEPTAFTNGDVAYHVPTNTAENVLYRDLRPDYVRDWYIFSDKNDVKGANGILDPGDTYVSEFKNWWTVESAHTQYNYKKRSVFETAGDYMGAPMNPVSSNAADNFWLSRESGVLNFYMTYSQFDNVDWPDYTEPNGADWYLKKKAELALRNRYTNGWALGFVANDHQGDSNAAQYDQTLAGRLKMDIFVHDGKRDTTYQDAGGAAQATRSNPAVSLSNDISILTLDRFAADMVHGQLQPPNYTDLDGADVGYLWDINKRRFMENFGNNEVVAKAAFDAVVASMQLYETDPYALTDPDVIINGKSPADILTSLGYEYQDAFLQRDRTDPSLGSPFGAGSNAGGVINGLGGKDNFDPADPNSDWADQQVIRIDLDTSVFEDFDPGTGLGGGIQKVVFWDFGDSTPGAAGTQQTDPQAIVFFVDMTRTVDDGQLFYAEMDINGDPVAGTEVYFPENRIYIAQVNHVPEPMTLVVLAAGGVATLVSRRRRKA